MVDGGLVVVVLTRGGRVRRIEVGREERKGLRGMRPAITLCVWVCMGGEAGATGWPQAVCAPGGQGREGGGWLTGAHWRWLGMTVVLFGWRGPLLVVPPVGPARQGNIEGRRVDAVPRAHRVMKWS